MAEDQNTSEQVAISPVEIPPEKQRLIEPWIEDFEKLDLTDPERISVLFGMGLAYCHKAGLDFNALLGATILAEQTKLAETEEAQSEKPETD